MEKTMAVDLAEAEIRMIVEALDARIEALMDWGQQSGHWKNPAERDVFLAPLVALSQKLMTA